MELLKTIKEEEAYPGTDPVKPEKWRFRRAARAVVFDDENRIALLHVSKHNYYKLPGGGIENSEAIEEALQRECLEEIGCRVIIKQEVGSIVEYRNKIGVEQESYCYLAKLDGEKGKAKLEQDEAEAGFETVWVGIDEAIELVENSKPKDTYDGSFIKIRDYILLNKAKESIKK